MRRLIAKMVLLGALIAALGGAKDAQAHRWTEAVATRQITAFIQKWQCENSATGRTCDAVIPPIPRPYGSHSWRWGPGVYYYQSLGFTGWQCKSWGIITSHDIRDSTGKLLRKGNSVYSYGSSCKR